MREPDDPHIHIRCQITSSICRAIIYQPYRQAYRRLNVVKKRLDRGRFVQCWHDNGGVHNDRGREGKFMSSIPVQPGGLLAGDYARQPSGAPFVIPALRVREARIGDPGAMSADKGV